MQDFVLGANAKLYFNASGTEVSPPTPANWTEMTNVKDLTLNLAKDEVEVNTRANNEWKARVGTLKDGSVQFDMVWNTGDAGFTAIQQAYLNNTTIGIACLDGEMDVAGSQGLIAAMGVFDFTRAEPVADVLTVSVTIKPTYDAIAPYWFTAV